jgi:N-acetyl-D-muramate 6-phosphate phosphatase
MTVVSVIFDVGETLLDDGREFGAWADWLGVPRHTFSAVLGAVTAAGRNNAETFGYFRPGFDLAAERQRREAAGAGEDYGEADLYPDARPALAALRDLGLWVGIAGNQTARAGRIFRELGLPADLIATSAEWCARSFKMRMTASFAVSMCGREYGPAGVRRRGLGVRGGVVVVSLT